MPIVFDVVNPGHRAMPEPRRASSAPRRVENNGNESGKALPILFVSSITPRPGPAEDPLYRRAGWSLESPDSGQADLDREHNGLASLNIRTLAMSQRDSHLLYAGTNGGGLYRSTDAGATWAPCHSRLPPRAG